MRRAHWAVTARPSRPLISGAPGRSGCGSARGVLAGSPSRATAWVRCGGPRGAAVQGPRAGPVLRPAAAPRRAKPGGPSWCPCVLTRGRSQGEGHVRCLGGQTPSWSRSLGAVRPPAQVATVTLPESCAHSDAVPAPLLRGARLRARHAAAQRRSVSAAAFREGRSGNRHRPLLPAAPAVPAAPQRLPGLSAFTFGRCFAGCRILDWQFFLSVR